MTMSKVWEGKIGFLVATSADLKRRLRAAGCYLSREKYFQALKKGKK